MTSIEEKIDLLIAKVDRLISLSDTPTDKLKTLTPAEVETLRAVLPAIVGYCGSDFRVSEALCDPAIAAISPPANVLGGLLAKAAATKIDIDGYQVERGP